MLSDIAAHREVIERPSQKHGRTKDAWSESSAITTGACVGAPTLARKNCVAQTCSVESVLRNNCLQRIAFFKDSPRLINSGSTHQAL